MFKRLFFVIAFFLSFNLSGQDIDQLRKKASNSSDSELIVFIQKAKDQGLSLVDAEKQLNLIGGKAQEIKKLRDLWNKKLPISSFTDLVDSKEIQSNFGDTEAFVEDSPDIKDEVEELKRFGSDFFKNKNITEAPQLFVATPSDYRLGPGDELIINLFGASENTYSVQISRNGNVKFDKLAPIYLSGLSIRSATKRLKSRLSKIYTGLNSSNSIEKVDLELSLQKARTIVVNITGQVEAPGTYTISGFSSVLNALYAAGGPNEVGTYRDVKVIRSGKIVYNVDLYDYFANGIYPNIYLRDQDVILVKPYQIQTELVSGFKQLSLFEMKKNETVSDLINLSGGLSSKAFKNAIFIEQEINREIVGSQDQVAASFGGFNKIAFKTDGQFEVSPITIEKKRSRYLNDHLLLFYSGIQRRAPEIEASKVANISSKEQNFRALMDLVTEAQDLLLADYFDPLDFGKLLHESWLLKRDLAKTVTSSEIDSIYATGISAGAVGGKVLGAGGGGFVLFLAAPERHLEIKRALSNLVCVDFAFENEGSTTYRLS